MAWQRPGIECEALQPSKAGEDGVFTEALSSEGGGRTCLGTDLLSSWGFTVVLHSDAPHPPPCPVHPVCLMDAYLSSSLSTGVISSVESFLFHLPREDWSWPLADVHTCPLHTFVYMSLTHAFSFSGLLAYFSWPPLGQCIPQGAGPIIFPL